MNKENEDVKCSTVLFFHINLLPSTLQTIGSFFSSKDWEAFDF
jgi:hypothetical protein